MSHLLSIYFSLFGLFWLFLLRLSLNPPFPLWRPSKYWPWIPGQHWQPSAHCSLQRPFMAFSTVASRSRARGARCRQPGRIGVHGYSAPERYITVAASSYIKTFVVWYSMHFYNYFSFRGNHLLQLFLLLLFIRYQGCNCSKVSLISESFFTLTQMSKKKAPNHYSDYLFFRRITLRVVIWYLFLEVWAKLRKTFWN